MEASSSSSKKSDTQIRLIQRILDATTLFARLVLPVSHAEPSAVKKQYRQLALVVHPDKCNHASAKEAFQKLSEAFDVIGDAAGQKRYIAELSSQRSSTVTQTQRAPSAAAKGRWWNTSTWEEFEKRFRHRDAAEAALHEEFTSGLKAKMNKKRVRSQVLLAERTTEHCDRAAGFTKSDLWPPEEGQHGSKKRSELNDPICAVPRLLDLITHLRTVHRYCLYCGCAFDSFDDLERNCPGFTEEEHEKAGNMATRTSKETALEKAGQVESWEEDPLDAFMAGNMDNLQADMEASRKRKRDDKDEGISYARFASNHVRS
eukprot:gnl/MRDRNA2_/MRDRNA2_145581_c0_seq1.p1 gnl/MRDRNA2_/MRDRNA2_145581_c0~~gnl/MRDRNA2_/MRDRNA2_145581_c0_seq1.p1  ORF type:complete len:360 (-),score=62.96 gnl/MRDRNA2_/MRDRNA2_145581_c0_seq1:117-1067(-)